MSEAMTVEEQLETAVALLEEIRLGQGVNKNHPVICTHPTEVPDPENRFRCGWCRRLDVFLASLNKGAP